MKCRRWMYQLICWCLCAIVCGGIGCSTSYHKQDADREVYRIIDSKWPTEFGTKANYRISDAEPSGGDKEVKLAVPVSGVLSLADAVAMATAHNRDYQSQKESLYLAALDLTLARYEFAPQFFGIISGQANREAEEKFRTIGGELGFDVLLATGAQITTSIATDWLRFLAGDPRESLTSVLSATLVQPLLRGGGRKVVQENLTQAERDVLYQIRTFNRFRKTFVVSIVTDYYRVLQALNAVENAENNYQRLKTAQKRLEMLAEAGRLPPFQVDQAQQDTLRASDTYVRALQQYERQLDRFKIRLSLPTDAQVELAPDELDGLAAAGISSPEFSEGEAIETALARRLDLANDRDRVDDTERKVAVAANDLATELNLIGSARVESPEDFRFGKIELNQGTYSLGLELDLPLDRKAERNAYREALISVLQRRREHGLAIDEVKFDVRQAYRDLREAAQRYEIQQKSLELAQRRVDSTAMLIQAGRADTRDLLESQAALLAAQNATTAALVDHAIAKLNFFRDIGVLQVRAGVGETVEVQVEEIRYGESR